MEQNTEPGAQQTVSHCGTPDLILYGLDSPPPRERRPVSVSLLKRCVDFFRRVTRALTAYYHWGTNLYARAGNLYVASGRVITVLG
jgi:hypothetical protein